MVRPKQGQVGGKGGGVVVGLVPQTRVWIPFVTQ